MTIYQIVSLVVFMWIWLVSWLPIIAAIRNGRGFEWSFGHTFFVIATAVNLIVSFTGVKGWY
jgi:hypothetical protein